MKKVYGLTLIEMMTSLTLSALLLSIISSSMSYAYLKYRLQTLSNSQLLQAQLISEMLLQEVHHAGYIGCINRHLIKNNFMAITNYGEKGFSVSHSSNKQAVLLEPAISHRSLITTLEQKFSKGDVGIISDCRNVEKFEIKHIDVTNAKQKILLSNRLIHLYEKSAYVGRLEKNSYDVINHQLFVEDINHRKIALIDQIEDLNVEFDENMNGKLIESRGNEVHDWNKVVGVGINLTFNQHFKWNLYAALQN